MPGILDRDNQLFALARTGKWVPPMFSAIATVPAVILVVIVTQVLSRILLGSGPAADAIAELLGFLSIFLALWILLRFWSRRPFWSLGFEAAGAGGRVLRGALCAAIMIAGIATLLMITGAQVRPGALQERGLSALETGFLAFLATSVQSSAEEALFRGWLLQALGNRFGPLAGVVVSSLIFALAHATNGPPPLGWLNLFLFGATAALIALAEGGLWGACAWHAIWNWTEGGLLGFSVDRTVRSGLAASIQTSGPEYITGGSFGPEGGLAVTIVLLGGIAALLILIHRLRTSSCDGRATALTDGS